MDITFEFRIIIVAHFYSILYYNIKYTILEFMLSAIVDQPLGSSSGPDM